MYLVQYRIWILFLLVFTVDGGLIIHTYCTFYKYLISSGMILKNTTKLEYKQKNNH